MKPVIKGCLFVLVITTIFISFIIFENIRDQKMDKDQIALIGNIEFKGKVIKSNIINRYGKAYYTMCIQLDSTNIDNFYVFNDLCALKIKNNIATMPGGLFDKTLIPEYVEVNLKKDLKVKIYYKNGENEEYSLGMGSGGLLESDLNLCN